MKSHLRWGVSFQAILPEFSTSQIEALQDHCRKLIEDADEIVVTGCRVSAIPFEMFGYDFILERVDLKLWSLEHVGFPPHAPDGVRLNGARRAREKAERMERDARSQKTRRRAEALYRLVRMRCTSRARTWLRGLHWLGLQTASKDATQGVRDALWHGADVLKTVEQVLYRTRRQRQSCQRLHERIDATLGIRSGKRLERRVFNIGGFEIALNSWAPIDPGFDEIWDISLFGVRLVESETL